METYVDLNVAILATDGFEESELFEPKKALEDRGIKTTVVAPELGKIKAWRHGEWTKELDVDASLDQAKGLDFDALLIPGGVINPDKLRRDPNAVDFVKSFFEKDKLVASICHGPQLLIEADEVKGRNMTSFFSIKKDLLNAGAVWVDEPVVKDGNLITSRNPDDLKFFNKALIREVIKSV